VVDVQALPYVALLIVMLFFIYAVIGMQVGVSSFIFDYYRRQRSKRLCFTRRLSVCLFACLTTSRENTDRIFVKI